MSAKLSSETFSNEKDSKKDMDTLDTVVEVNENVANELFDRPSEEGNFEEIAPKIFGLKVVEEPLTLPSLDNAIYELGVVNLCWPVINEPIFETRTCFPQSYYNNSTKEQLLLAYSENFRRQFFFHFPMRRPLLFQVPNECGLQKMVCTSIRPTKLCFDTTNTWQGVASLVADYFDYEPLTKPMLHTAELETRYHGGEQKMQHLLIAATIMPVFHPTPKSFGGFTTLYGFTSNATPTEGGVTWIRFPARWKYLPRRDWETSAIAAANHFL